MKDAKRILGKALSRWDCAARDGAAPSTRVNEGAAKMQLHRDLQGLAGGAPWRGHQAPGDPLEPPARPGIPESLGTWFKKSWGQEKCNYYHLAVECAAF